MRVRNEPGVGLKAPPVEAVVEISTQLPPKSPPLSKEVKARVVSLPLQTVKLVSNPALTVLDTVKFNVLLTPTESMQLLASCTENNLKAVLTVGQ